MKAWTETFFVVPSFLCLIVCLRCEFIGQKLEEKELAAYRERVVRMFYHAYDGYIRHAYPYDELRPLTCDGQDTWGSFSLTLIDALDTLAVLGNHSEFRRVAHLLINKASFDIDINASVFETNIRVVGGLISAHLFSKKADMLLEPGWPCTGPLLRLAENVARRILPAFNTTTGMPYGTVNLRYGVPKGETPITCTAGVGTYIVEFGALSRLTGDPVFERTAMRALRALWQSRSEIGLVGNHIDVVSGKWTATDAGIGGGVDSYFEYLVKGAVMFQNSELLQMYRDFEAVLETYVKRDDWYMWASMKKGGITSPVFQSLDAFWPGMQSLLGDIEKGMKTIHNYHQVWRQYGFTPELYNIPKGEAHSGREGYPLRPELVESAVYLYRATEDPYLLGIGIDVLEAIEHSTRTDCGFATVKDVTTHQLENRMESFFLAETTKYLYLLFTPNHFIHNIGNHGDIIQTPNGECIIDTGGYIFNTEAHPIDLAAMYCCSGQKKEDDKAIQDLHDNLDLLTLLNIIDPSQDLFAGRKWEKKRKKPRGMKNKSKDGVLPGVQEKQTVKNVKGREVTVKSKTINGEDKTVTVSIQTSNDSPRQGIIQKTDNDADVVVVKGTSNSGTVESISTEQLENDDSESVVGSKTEEFLREVTSKLAIDHNDLSTLLKNLQKLGELEDHVETTDDSPGDNVNVKNSADASSESSSNQGSEMDKSQESSNDKSAVPEIATVEQEGAWVRITSKSRREKTEDSDSSKQTANAEKINELTEMIKNALTSSSQQVFSGNSGFSFGPKTKTTDTSDTESARMTVEDKNMFGRHRPELLVCPAQPFHMRLSAMGEMFED